MSSGESMVCLSPQIPRATQDDVAVDVRFKMDSVDVSQSSFQLLYVRDPTIIPANTTCTTLPENLFAFLLRIQVCTLKSSFYNHVMFCFHL